jgi:hypothetical protein
MAEHSVRIPFPLPDSPLREGFEVPVSESTERWTDVLLEDGTVLRVKASIVSAVRINGEFDADGNPAYALKVNPTITLVAPDHLKRSKEITTPVQ